MRPLNEIKVQRPLTTHAASEDARHGIATAYLANVTLRARPASR